MGGLFGGGGGIDFDAAVKAQERMGQLAANTELQMYNQARADLGPGIRAYEMGMPQVGSWLNVPGYYPIANPSADLAGTPGYRFAQQQGISALGNYAAPRGLSMSGSQMKGVEAFGTGLAEQTYQQYINNLMQFSGMGQAASSTTGGYGMNAASGMANAYMGIGDAQANAIMASGLQRQSGFGMNDLFGAIGMGLGAFAGGPYSAVAGIGGALGGLFG